MNAGEYDYMYQVEENLWWYRGLRDTLVFYLQAYAPRKARMLDAGCGTGMNMRLVELLGHTAYGIDVSAKAVMYTKKRGLTNIKKGSITQIPYGDKKYDVVLCMDVIGLLSDTQVKEALVESYRVLKPGGILMVHTAAFEFLRSNHDTVSHVKRRYTKNQIAKIFSTKKWHIQKLSYRMFLLFLPLAAVKLAKRLFVRAIPQGDLYLPTSLLNTTLYRIQQVENFLIRYYTLPFGTSLLVIAQKK